MEGGVVGTSAPVMLKGASLRLPPSAGEKLANILCEIKGN